jgi:transcriptional regulator GlxA family with amidase domain
VNETTYELRPGEAILLKPDGLESYSFSNECKSEHLWCEAVATGFSTEQIQLLRSSSGVHVANPFIHSLIEQGLRIRGANEGTADCVFGALAEACLLYATLGGSGNAQTRSPATHPVLRDAMEIASAEFQSLSSASQLARRLGISATHLRLLFRRHLKESPSAYLWRLKTERAIQLLRSTGLTIKEVADQCGFADAFHLSRRVKALSGEPPRRLRQREWNPGVS